MRHFGLFEGIGGFSLAARWMGWETVGWCEWDPFCQQVLRKNFPEIRKRYLDILIGVQRNRKIPVYSGIGKGNGIVKLLVIWSKNRPVDIIMPALANGAEYGCDNPINLWIEGISKGCNPHSTPSN